MIKELSYLELLLSSPRRPEAYVNKDTVCRRLFMKKYEAVLLAPVMDALKLLMPVVSVIQKKVSGAGMTVSIMMVARDSQTESVAAERVRDSLWFESS